MGNTTEISDRIRILVCCHKRDVAADKAPYMPIHVGKALSENNLDMQRDDTGDNISAKNQNYCELTAVYWAWKNLKDVDYVGLCHYRRFLDLTAIPKYRINTFVTVDEMQKHTDIDFSLLRRYDAIVSLPLVGILSLKDSYCLSHISEDYAALDAAVKKLYPDYYPDFVKVMDYNNQYSFGNIMVTRKEIFDDYAKWLFDILFEVEKNVKISAYPYQSRVFGFMSERLMNVYLYHNKLKVLRRPVLSAADGRNVSVFRDFCNRTVRNIVFRVNNYILK